MYIWAGCKLPGDFEAAVRSRCLELNQKVGLDTVAFLLPQHVSLKISFQSEKYQEILDYLTDFLSRQAPFSLRIQNPEQAGSILWLPVEENLRLRQLHEQLDAQLEQHFGIPQHQFDKYFLFHSTLFMDLDTDRIAQMCRMLEEYPIERELQVDTFLLGLSETGKPGECRIVREIKV